MPYLSVAAAAEVLSVSQRTIRRLIATGQLPAYRVGQSVRIRPDDLRRAAQPVASSSLGGDAA